MLITVNELDEEANICSNQVSEEEEAAKPESGISQTVNSSTCIYQSSPFTLFMLIHAIHAHAHAHAHVMERRERES